MKRFHLKGIRNEYWINLISKLMYSIQTSKYCAVIHFLKLICLRSLRLNKIYLREIYEHKLL